MWIMSAISTRTYSANTKQRAKQLADGGHTVDRRCSNFRFVI